MHCKWVKLAAEMLDAYSARLGNDTCNDWEWPEDWTEEEREQFAVACAETNLGKPLSQFTDREKEDYLHHSPGDDHGPDDWIVASFLAEVLSREANG